MIISWVLAVIFLGWYMSARNYSGEVKREYDKCSQDYTTCNQTIINAENKVKQIEYYYDQEPLEIPEIDYNEYDQDCIEEESNKHVGEYEIIDENGNITESTRTEYDFQKCIIYDDEEIYYEPAILEEEPTLQQIADKCYEWDWIFDNHICIRPMENYVE